MITASSYVGCVTQQKARNVITESRLADKCWQVVCEVCMSRGTISGEGGGATLSFYITQVGLYPSNRLNMLNSDLCVFLLGACVSAILRMTCLLWKSLLV